jgi:neutral ceramidase
MPDALLVGAAEVDITPPVGVSLAGSLQPRPSVGTDDPLFAKAVVLESRGVPIAYVLLDLIALGRSEGDRAVQLASTATGIPAEQIVWAASHTHTGPYTMRFLGAEGKDVDEAWLAGLPARIAQAVTKAWEARQPARMSRLRGYCSRVSHNRRLKMKDGRELNTWLLHRGEEEVQCLGAAGPIDPELGMLCFDDAAGDPIAVLWQFTLHTNTNFGPRFSGDYPAVVAARLRERFGRDVVSIFVPGACADINTPGPFYREVGNTLADVMVPLLAKRVPRAGSLALGARKARVVVSYRDFTADQETRIRDSQWPPADQESFRQELAVMREVGVTEEESVVQAWRIGEVAFASLPGELFVEWGLKLKAESPFPWTYPVELGGDYLGYLVTEQAWAAGGYESLIARSARPSVEGVARLYAAAQGLLGQLWAETPA